MTLPKMDPFELRVWIQAVEDIQLIKSRMPEWKDVSLARVLSALLMWIAIDEALALEDYTTVDELLARARSLSHLFAEAQRHAAPKEDRPASS